MADKHAKRQGRVHSAVAAVLLFCCTVAAQESGPVSAAGCIDGTNYETAGYRIRSVRIHHPFGFLRWLHPALQSAEELARPLRGEPFRYSTARQIRDELDKVTWLPSFADQRVHISLIISTVENCEAGELDLVYSIYSSQIAAVPSFTWESRQVETQSPQSTAGADPAGGTFRLKPMMQYNKTEQAGGGIQAEYLLPGQADFFLKSISAAVIKSRNGHEFNGSVEGAWEHSSNRLAQTRWSFGYQNVSTPLFDTRLKMVRTSAWVSTTTRPLFGLLPLRFGTSVDLGRHKSDAVSPTDETDHDTDYRSLKLFAGLVSRTKRNVVAGSYGMEFGGSDGKGLDWRKQVVDIVHELSWPVQDHRYLEVESRFTGGKLSVLGVVPIGTRFFGGNKEEFLTTDNEWQIRSNPFIRSLPANRFTEGRTGADSFAAYNLTVAYPVWNFPMIPGELTSNDEFTSALDGQLVTATSILQSDYVARDSHFRRAADMLPDVAKVLTNIRSAVTAARTVPSSADDPMTALFESCAGALNIAERRTQSALESRGSEQYGRVLALLPSDEDRLNRVLEICVDGLNSKIGNPGIALASGPLKNLVSALIDEFGQIDNDRAAMEAEAEMAYVKRTLDTLLYEVNVFSLSPAAMFDAARIRDSISLTSLSRFGVGGGIRMTLISHLSFTIGYLANPTRNSNEPGGALSFSLQYRDLFN